MPRVEKILLALKSCYGTPRQAQHDPVETLVLTILSQNTNDANRDKAYSQLKKDFPTWKQTGSAPLAKLSNSIRTAGLASSKARAIKEALRRLRGEFGSYTLAPLRSRPLEEARSFLLSINGVGPKTAAVVLSFSLNKPAFPVDTHIFRVSKRLNLIPEKTTIIKAHQLLEKSIPPSQVYSAHLLLIEHGREVCTARKPKCPACPLKKLCPYEGKTV